MIRRTFSKVDFGTTFTSKAYERDGVWHWASNNAPVPLDAAEEYGIPVDAVAQAAALDAYYARVIGEYRQREASLTPADRREREAEARAAHGPGVKLVDVFTGRSWTT